MAKARIVRFAESWAPDPDDGRGEDKRILVRYLIENRVDSSNPRPIARVLRETRLGERYTKESLQHNILGPLRREPRLFVGTSSKGIFLVLSPEDADATLGFYTWRVRAELRHARNLRALAKRAKLFDGHTSTIPDNKERAVIYLDESGSANVADLNPPVFVVAAVVINSNLEMAGLDQRFRNAFAAIRRPEDHELKSARLSVRKHAQVLRELTLLDYQWAAACFHKGRLTGPGFADPKTLFKYAFQSLVSDLLTIAWQADLVIDEHSSPEFQAEFEAYLRQQNSGLPVSRLQAVRFAQSSKERLVQLADLVAGAVRRAVDGQGAPLREIEHQQVNLQFWPPRT